MAYHFHTTLPVIGEFSTDDVWVCAELRWDQEGHPRIVEFTCDDAEVLELLNVEGTPAVELAIIDDAMRLHNAHTNLQ